MQQHPTHKNASGFTLIEMLIVIAIIAILASVAIPQFNQYKIRAYDAHSKQALKDMHLLCNAYWLDTDSTQGCDLPIIKEATYGFNQNADVVATLSPSPLDNFCASAKHNSSPNTFSIDSAALISETGDCGTGALTAEKKKYESCENLSEEWNDVKFSHQYGYSKRITTATFVPNKYFKGSGWEDYYGEGHEPAKAKGYCVFLGRGGRPYLRRPGCTSGVVRVPCEEHPAGCGTEYGETVPVKKNCASLTGARVFVNTPIFKALRAYLKDGNPLFTNGFGDCAEGNSQRIFPGITTAQIQESCP